MSGLVHGIRKRLSIATTRTKTVEKDMSNVYTTEKHTLLREKNTLEKALEGITKARSTWKEVSEAYQKFGDLVVGDAPVDSALYPIAAEAAAAANALQAHVTTPPDATAASSRLEAHVRTYLAELATIEKECPAVESGFVEVNRYKRKVNKLSDKVAKADKSKTGDKAKERTTRNLDKLESERAAYSTKLEGVIDMMKRASAKYEVILHCAMVAFWLSEGDGIGALDARTKNIREQAKKKQDELVALDVSNIVKETPPPPALEAPPTNTASEPVGDVVAAAPPASS